MVTKTKQGATDPSRVFEKVQEARFFLDRMAENETNPQIFCYYLSAFLNSSRVTIFRLYGVTRTLWSEAAKHALKARVYAHPQIGSLRMKSNVETHENGVHIWKQHTISIVPNPPERWPSRFEPRYEPERWKSRWDESFETKLTFLGWQFVGDSSNLVSLCREGLQALEDFAVQAISTGKIGSPQCLK